MDMQTHQDKLSIHIVIGAAYDYTSVNQFFEIMRTVQFEPAEIELDFSATLHADSSALGMLLHLRSVYPQSRVLLANCKPSIYRLFYIAKLQDVFILESPLDKIETIAA